MTFRQSVPAFLGGISQQSKAIRPTNLVDDSVNMEYLPTEGATKRFPTEHIADYGITQDPAKTQVVAMSRDDADFLVAVDDTAVKVFNADGTIESVTVASGAFDYLSGATHDSFRFQQVADTLYVANVDVTVLGAPGRDYAPWRQEGDMGVFVEQTTWEHSYTLDYAGINVSVTTQDVSDILTARPFSGNFGSVYAQPYRITAGQAAGTDPIMLLELDAEMRVNTIGDLDIRTIADTQFQWNTALPATDFGVPQIRSSDAAPPASGQPTAWISDYSAGTGIGPIKGVVPVAFDPNFQAIWLQPNELSAGDWIGIGRAQVTNTSQVSPQYVARQLALAVNLAAGPTSVEPYWLLGPSKDPEQLLCSSFLMVPGAPVNVAPTMTVVNTGTGTTISEWGRFIDDEVTEIQELPASYKQGAIVEVTGRVGFGEDNYFVQFVTDAWREETGSDEDKLFTYTTPDDLFGQGGWRETAEPGLTTGGLDSSTMPHRLQRDSNGDWTFEPVGWGIRPSGDNTSNPEPSFVGGRILDIFYHEDRLGFTSDANIIMSESGEIENFWRTTVLAVPDSDPIDVTLASLGGAAVYHAVPFDRKLFAFSETAQAAIDGSGGPLSPATISAKVTGQYRTSPSISPVAQGNSLFSPYTTGSSVQIRELVPGQYEGDLQAVETTLAVPRLLPSTTRKVMTASGGNDLVCLTEDGQFFLYQYLRAGNQSLMSAWGRWEFPGGTLVDAATIRDSVYLFINRDGTTRLEKVLLGSGRGDLTESFKPRMDRLSLIDDPADRTYDRGTNTTTFTVPFDFAADDTLLLVVSDGAGYEYGAPVPVSSQDAVAGTVSAKMDLSAVDVWVGQQYDSSLTMTRPVVQAPSQQGGNTSVIGGRTLVRDFTVTLTDTGYLRATVEAVGQDTATEEFLSDRMDVGEINPSVLGSREFSVPIHASSDEFRLTLSNDTAMPSTLVNGAWAIRFNARYRQS